jgi:hypothetical protein
LQDDRAEGALICVSIEANRQRAYAVTPGAFGRRALDGGQLLAAAAERIGDDEALPLSKGMKRKQKHKDRDRKKSKHRDRTKEASLKLNARQLKASVAAMRAERESREAAERAREKQLLRKSFLG